MPKAPRRVTLLTDFGTADGYVGAMKGIIASIIPAAFIDDISHDIPSGDIAAGAWCLATAWSFHAAGTVHVCVVDPGVGTDRRAIAAAAAGQLFVAPDNGLLTHVLKPDATVVEIRERRFMREGLSRTFHGRDVFAPVAAHLAAGTSITDLGPVIEDPVRLPVAEVRHGAASVSGEVVHVDRFGNLITNITAAHVTPGARITLQGRANVAVRLVATYGDAAEGEAAALIGSAGVLEIAVRNGSAAERLGAKRGMTVMVEA